MMENTRLEYLFSNYLTDDLTIDEEAELMTLLKLPEMQEEVKELIGKFILNSDENVELTAESATSILKNIFEKQQGAVTPIQKPAKTLKFWVGVAASLILVLAAGIFYKALHSGNSNKKIVTATNTKVAPVLPKGNHPLLTTSDGTVVLLDSLTNGSVLQKGAATISKNGSVLIYKVGDLSTSSSEVVYNTLSTPAGGQYEVVLPDGSKVWLNAASSLHFPSVFMGKQRIVELTGEAYFEVAKNKAKPFQVRVREMQVNVLGTHFNVNAYDDENDIKTSLLEGSVKITRGRTVGILRPGQQALLDGNNKVQIENVNMDRVVAWKNGLFQFEGADIRTIMREISRWYGVEVEFSGKLADRRFEGKISRSVALKEVLRILELSGVRFTLEGNRIIVA